MKRLFLLLALIICSILRLDAQDTLVLLGGELIDGTGAPPIPNSVIVIKGKTIILVGPREWATEKGKLVSKIRTPKGLLDIPENAGVYDIAGKVVMPGLIDAHVHYDGVERDLLQMLAWGVTSANCMVEASARGLALERQTAPDTVPSPQLYATAPIFSAKNGWWWGKDFPNDPAINRFPATPGEARAQVILARKKGIKRIKLMYDDMRWCRDSLPPLVRMKKNVMRALLDEAGRQGLVAEIHSPQLADAQDVLAAGIVRKGKTVHEDTGARAAQIGSFGFAHGILDDTLPGPFVQSMLSKHAFYIPTFSVFNFLANTPVFIQHAMGEYRMAIAMPESLAKYYMSSEYLDGYRQRYPNSAFVRAHLPNLQWNMKTLFDHHVPVVMGTDMWAFPGYGAHMELEYLVQAGLTPMQAIVAATSMAARFLGRDSTLGTIEAGKQADILLLELNPLQSIINTRSVSRIIKQGTIYNHKELIDLTKKK